MTDVSTAAQADTPAAPEPNIAPAPQAAEAPPAASADDVEAKLEAAGFRGNLDAALEAAKSHRTAENAGVYDYYSKVTEQRDRLGMSREEFLYQLSAVEREEAEAAAATAQPDPAQATQPVTAQGVEEIVSNALLGMREQDRVDFQAQQDANAVQAARQADDRFLMDTLTQGKFEVPTSGALPLGTIGPAATLQQCLRNAKLAGITEFSTEAQRDAALAAHPTQAQLDAAKTAFVAHLKDRDLKAADKYAADQSTIQASVPAGSPSGATEPSEPKDIMKGTLSERNAFMQRVFEKMGVTEEQVADDMGFSET